MTLLEIQNYLSQSGYDAYILTRNNMFLGQDILPEENKILALSGFSGSAGNLIICPNKSYLLVDGRYELQASQEVDQTQIEVVCTNDSIATWINNNFLTPFKIAYNPWCHSVNEVDYWQRVLKKHTFIADNSEIFGSRLTIKDVHIFEHDIEFCGISTEEKISYLTNFIHEHNLDAYFISACDSVSWLLNLRSNLLADTPIFRAFALIDKDGNVSLFTNDMNKIKKELSAFKNQTIGISYAKTPKQIQLLMKGQKIWLENISNPIDEWKAIKNSIELSGIKNAHLRDGIAMVKFLYWLENNWSSQDELSIVKKLRSFREKEAHFYSDSFGTIAAFGPNGAIVHYQPTSKTNLKLTKDSVLLLDSGAQYFDGTTDITRTIAIGTPSDDIRDSFTQVLKAHIAASSAVFPEGTSGSVIDAITRAQLWQFGKEYHHGTGHGVGCFLSVHEGPFSLSSKNTHPLKAGMITSIEPGFYKTGEYGIRIENLAYIVSEPNIQSEMNLLRFEPLTLVPLDKRLINKYLLSSAEIKWLNTYHADVYQKLHKHLDSKTAKWLQQACAPL